MKQGTRWKRGIALFAVMAALLGVLMTGCDQQIKPIEAQSEDKPASMVSGYYEPAQSLHGGTDIDRLNLRDIEIVREGDDLVVILTFMDGSAQMGMEEKPAAGVPLYETHYQTGVDRLELDIDGLAFWDYRIYPVEIENTLIQGIFKQIPVGSETTRLYFNTRDQYAYRIESVNHQLFIYMRPLQEEETISWYVTIDGFGEYTEGKLPSDFAMTPSLCDDLSNKTLISQPFATEQEAQAFVESQRTVFETKLPGKTPILVQLRSNQLPAYDESTELSALTNTPVGRIDGEEKTFPGFIENGRFLCWNPNGTTYAFVRPFFLSSSQEDEVYMNEQIWVGDTIQGTPIPLVEYDFTSIVKAEYSADGRYLAFIEQTDSVRMLQIIDTDTGRVTIAAEDDFGEDTADFVWDTHMPRLYAITGGMEGMQMMCYDLTGGENDVSVYALEEEAFTEGDIGRSGDCIYFSQSSPESISGSIYSFNIDTGERTAVTTGYEMAMAPGGRWMAVSDIIEDGESDEDRYCLKAVGLDGTEVVVDDQDVIVDYVWSLDGSRLYYTVYRDTTMLEEEYQLGLYCYNVTTQQSQYIMDMVTGALYPDNSKDSVLMMYIYNQMGRSIPVTYRIKS